MSNVTPMPKRGWSRNDTEEWSVKVPGWVTFLLGKRA